MRNKKLQVWLPFMFALMTAIGMLIGYKLREDTAGGSVLKNTSNSSVNEIINLINKQYVDPIGGDSIQTKAIQELLSHLDPHSVYIPANRLQDINDEMHGNFQGIGVEFQIFSDTLNVVNVMPDGPSDKAGLQTGDKFLAVNDSIVIAGTKKTPADIRKILRGGAGSSVKIKILRNGQAKDFVIKRGIVPLYSLDAAYMLTAETGYIRLNKFSETTHKEFMQAMEMLQAKGLKKLVLDLRGNGGGLMDQAVSIAEDFLGSDKLIVYTNGAHLGKTEYRSKGDGLFETTPLAVLVDETSASASEILSGALQDWDRATIIGRRTFGKGLVQQQYMLSNGGALRLTVARYYTPLGRNIQKPYNKGFEQYQDELIERFHDGEVVQGDTSKPKGKAYKTPKGRMVYGGGGITPDIFIPFDTTLQPKPIIQLYYKGTLNQFVYNYYMQNKAALTQIKTPEDLSNQYAQYSAGIWNELVSYAKKDSINIDVISLNAKNDLLQKIGGLIAKQIWRTEGYYEMENIHDPMIKKALETLK
ncbi:MAG: S41 family peptidase [Chitinophagaceae bacterium]|jgi:carboxyl-terminal processing protease|nr:S41 family peptidase [Chitinophagaceae bacterium]